MDRENLLTPIAAAKAQKRALDASEAGHLVVYNSIHYPCEELK